MGYVLRKNGVYLIFAFETLPTQFCIINQTNRISAPM